MKLIETQAPLPQKSTTPSAPKSIERHWSVEVVMVPAALRNLSISLASSCSADIDHSESSEQGTYRQPEK